MSAQESLLADEWAELMENRGMPKTAVQNERRGAEVAYGSDGLRRNISILRGLQNQVRKIERTVDALDSDLVGGQGVVILAYYSSGSPFALLRMSVGDLYDEYVGRGARPFRMDEVFQAAVKGLENKGFTVRAAYWGLKSDLFIAGSGLDQISRDFDSAKSFEQSEQIAKKIDSFVTGRAESTSESLASQLEQLFPNADGAILESIVTSLDTQIKTLRKTTDKTYTGIVLDFEIDGKRVYCKVGSKAMLAKEAQYAKDAWQHQLMRPITPKSIGLVNAGDLAGLLTYGTENIGIVAPEDFMAYFNMKNSLEKKFAKQESIDSKVLSKDPVITDMFNRAIAHTYMKEHMANPIYRTAMLDSVAPIEKLESRLCESTLPKDKITEIVKLFPLYMRLAEETAEYDKEPTILAHFDPRAENIFPSRLGSRPTGDFGSAKPGTPEFDLGKMEVPNTDFYVQAYAFFRNALEQAEGNNFELAAKDITELQDKVRKIGFVNALKMACFKSSRGLDPSRYVNLSREYAQLLQ